MNETIARREYSQAKVFLRDINERYSGFQLNNIVQVIPIAYPIAIFNTIVAEKSFESFDIIEHTILRLLSLDYDIEMIEKLTGLKQFYVNRIVNLLRGYELIDNNGLTSLGLESIQTEKKIQRHDVLYELQVDAVMGSLIKLDELIERETIKNKTETSVHVGHLEYVETIDFGAVEEGLKQHFDKHIKSPYSGLHINTIAINSVRFKELKYAHAYYVRCINEEPIIFTKRFVAGKNNFKERFVWMPSFVNNENERINHGFDETIPIIKNRAQEIVWRFRDSLSEKQSRYEAGLICKLGSFVLGLNKEYTKYIENQFFQIIVNENSFTICNKFVLDYLEAVAESGKEIIVNDSITGDSLVVLTNDQKINETAKLYKEMITRYDRKEIRSYILESSNNDKKHIISSIYEALKTYIVEEVSSDEIVEDVIEAENVEN